jgi:prolyl-tRNA synthetase
VELYNDKDGIVMPASIAPFTVVVTPVNFTDPAQNKAATDIYTTAKALGLDALLDDRDERPGVKFKDAELIGIPYRITIGKKLALGFVEVVDRRTKTSTDVAVAEAASFVKARLAENTK